MLIALNQDPNYVKVQQGVDIELITQTLTFKIKHNICKFG